MAWYVCQPEREPALHSTSTLIWVKRSLISVSQSLGDATAAATHSAAARLTQLLPVGMETPWDQLNYPKLAPKKTPERRSINGSNEIQSWVVHNRLSG